MAASGGKVAGIKASSYPEPGEPDYPSTVSMSSEQKKSNMDPRKQGRPKEKGNSTFRLWRKNILFFKS